jgi:hypothetical protein
VITRILLRVFLEKKADGKRQEAGETKKVENKRV